ncbi:MAG: hypothetical protein Q8922_08515 [Bacteroidota bacterium]|nr:hypothetical protein [Bacteroidota bacterium]MDP4233471.1 hypothetical protein [Bacteroidota bacterium]MDP4243349.1 hypothetical protein [Bacteroidota bacterium]MDP4287965.1 hypothetical protein [Bacteroidota bacterium]
MTAKQQIIAMIETLPEDWSVEDIEFYVYMRKRIQHSVNDLRERHMVSHPELQRQILAWKMRLLGTK